MSKIDGLLWYLLIIFISLNLCSSGLIKCVLNKVENCNQNGADAWKLNLTVKTTDGKQYIDGTVIFERNLDNTIWFNTTVERMTNGEYLYLFSFRENKTCTALNRYFGEFLYDFERMGQIIPGICPIQKGKYYWHNTFLHLEKIPTLSSFPFGTLLITTNLFDSNNIFYACYFIEARLYM